MLNTIFHDPRGKIAIIEKVNNFLTTKFYDDPDKVVVGHLNDTYVGCCTYREGIRKGSKGSKADVVGLHAFWIDLDFNDGTHKKKGLPTKIEADKVIEDSFPTPTVKVNSGFGYHLWYVLRKSVDISREEDRQLWEHRMKMFQDRFRAFFTVDSTHNLDRILRVEGTMNHKHGEPVPVIAEYSSDMYEWADLEPTDGEIKPQETIEVKSNGKCPIEKVNALMGQNEAFKEVFLRKSVVGDGTPSAYDFSIAVHCLKAGFDPGEVKETIIASTVEAEGKRSKKHSRQDYFDRTISKAKLVVESELILGFKVIRFLKYMSDPPSYELHTDKGVVKLQGINELISTSRFAMRIAEYLDFFPDLPKPKDWKPIVSELLDRHEKVDLGKDGTMQDIIETAICDYILEEGVEHIVIQEFRYWLDIKTKNNMPISKLAKHLRVAGYKPNLVYIDEKRTRVWSKNP